ncbi:MAG: hypothetical protein EBU29_06265 [Gammaproteobacteria bacterium]|nr:hypothetical protein [Gammaproteobacteria bacterium]
MIARRVFSFAFAPRPALQFSDQLGAESLSLELLGKRLTRESGALWLRTLQGRLAGVPVSFSDAALAWRGGVDPELRVYLPRLSLRTASELAAAWPRRPETLEPWLRRLALDGQLTDLRLRLNPEEPLESLAFAASLADLRATAYRGMPTVRGLDGRLQATARGIAAPFTYTSPGSLRRVGSMTQGRGCWRSSGPRLGSKWKAGTSRSGGRRPRPRGPSPFA